MAKTIEQILGYKNLTGIMQSPTLGVPNVWPEEFMSLTRDIEGDSADMIVVSASRQTAPSVNYGSASKRVAQETISGRSGKCIHSFFNITHKASTLVALRNMDDMNMQRKGQQVVDFQTQEARRKSDNLRISSVNSVMRYGAIYFDGNGNLLPSSSGAVLTVDMQVPANNKNQLNSAIQASWATAGTDILLSMSNVKKAAVQNTGRPIKYAYYGSAIPGYLANNTAIKELMKSDAALTSSLRQNRIPTGFGIEGIEWRPLDVSYFVDADGTNREWFPSDYVVFMPEVDRSWYEMQQGSFLIPTDLNPAPDVNTALANLEAQYGMFSYAALLRDPVALIQYFGDTFLPVLRDPSSIYIADTAF